MAKNNERWCKYNDCTLHLYFVSMETQPGSGELNTTIDASGGSGLPLMWAMISRLVMCERTRYISLGRWSLAVIKLMMED